MTDDTPLGKTLNALYATTGAEPKRSGLGWSARCPAHDDRHESLSAAEGDDGRVLLHCHAGCTPGAVCAALGLTLADLMPSDNGRPRKSKPKPTRQTWPTAREAVEALEQRHGPRAATWTYRDAAGEPVGLVVRWDTPTGKDIRPVSRGADGRWLIGAMPEPRPLYLAESLGTEKRVYVTEGEKAADAARSIGLVAATSAGGSKAAHKSDWTPLAGRDAIVLPDNDAPGRRYSDDVAGILRGLRPAATVHAVELPGLDPGGDIADYVNAGRAAGRSDTDLRQSIEALADATPRVSTVAPVPAWTPFPVDALPDPVDAYVRDGSRSIGCDPTMIALPLLAGLASAVGATRRVELKSDWSEPSVLWTCILGDSGTMKSPAQGLALAPLRRLQSYRLEEFPELLQAHERNLLLYDVDLKDWKTKGCKSGQEPPEKPQEPTVARYLQMTLRPRRWRSN